MRSWGEERWPLSGKLFVELLTAFGEPLERRNIESHVMSCDTTWNLYTCHLSVPDGPISVKTCRL